MHQHALQAAKEGDIDHLRTLFSRHGDLTLCRRLDVLARIPCDVDPSSYSDLLPSIPIQPESRNRGDAKEEEVVVEGLKSRTGVLRSSEEGVHSAGNPLNGAADGWEDGEDEDDDGESHVVRHHGGAGEESGGVSPSLTAPLVEDGGVDCAGNVNNDDDDDASSLTFRSQQQHFWWKGGGVVQPFRPSEGIRHTKSGRDWVEAVEVMQVRLFCLSVFGPRSSVCLLLLWSCDS
jgi:hypothetical protein